MFITFWGMGEKSIARRVSASEEVTLTYSYFHLMWLLRWSYQLEYQLTGRTPEGWRQTRTLSRREVRERGFHRTVRLNWWERWSLASVLLAFILIIVSAELDGTWT